MAARLSTKQVEEAVARESNKERFLQAGVDVGSKKQIAAWAGGCVAGPFEGH